MAVLDHYVDCGMLNVQFCLYVFLSRADSIKSSCPDYFFIISLVFVLSFHHIFLLMSKKKILVDIIMLFLHFLSAQIVIIWANKRNIFGKHMNSYFICQKKALNSSQLSATLERLAFYEKTHERIPFES